MRYPGEPMADAPAEQPAQTPQAPDEALLRELHGTLSAGSRERIVEAWNERGGLLTDVFLELGVATETQFLRYFAVKYATRFILAEKLGPAAVEERVRDLVPVRVAERLGLLPLFYDERTKQLTVVAAVPPVVEPEVVPTVPAAPSAAMLVMGAPTIIIPLIAKIEMSFFILTFSSLLKIPPGFLEFFSKEQG